MAYRVLIVDDDHLMARSLSRCLESEGFLGFVVHSGEDAMRVLKREEFDLVLLDLSMPGLDGFQTLEGIKADYPDLQVVILTASQDIHDAIWAMKHGADDYLIKSSDMEEAVQLVAKKALKTASLAKENALLKRQTQERINQYCLVTESSSMRLVYQLIEKIAQKEHSTVLIIGESGTGKEVVARTIHNLSPNPEKAFIDISCSSLPDSLVESELFGFEKGAFTDAKSAKQGLLELADGGTLFLDEIATLNLSVQAKLLRFLEQRTFRRIGSTIDRQVDIRIIAATNRDLAKKVSRGEFREDLFYRLNVFPITIPPLRERKEDIMPLANFFIQRFNQKLHLNIQGFNQQAAQLLVNYTYPGNIRELKNIIERAMIIEDSELITPSSLHFPKGEMFFAEPILTDDTSAYLQPAEADQPTQQPEKFLTLAEMEKAHILKALKQAGGNKEQAAKLLGIGRSTLFRKLAGLEGDLP